MAGLLLPVRLLFVEFVSDSWFGSLGVITAVSLTVVVLAKKQKLGFFGHMLERQMFNFQKGKRIWIVFGESAFLLTILGLMIFAIDYGNSLSAESTLVGSMSTEELIETTKELTPTDWIFGIIMAPIGFITAFPEMSMAIASIDQKLDGWLMHFYTVGFVEYLELVGILIYYKISFRKKAIISRYAKTAI